MVDGEKRTSTVSTQSSGIRQRRSPPSTIAMLTIFSAPNSLWFGLAKAGALQRLDDRDHRLDRVDADRLVGGVGADALDRDVHVEDAALRGADVEIGRLADDAGLGGQPLRRSARRVPSPPSKWLGTPSTTTSPPFGSPSAASTVAATTIAVVPPFMSVEPGP